MAKNTLPIIIGAVLFGVLALGLTFYTLLSGGNAVAPPEAANGNTTTAQAGPSSTIYKARRPIYPRTVITRDMLEEAEGEATNGAITDPDAIVGRLANRVIQQGQTLTAETVTTDVGRVIPANIAIPAGLRGVAVWVDPTQTAAGLIDAGDRVDVIVTHDLQIEKSGTQVIVGATQYTSGRTIAQDLQVLAVDKSIQQYRPPAPPTPEGAQPAPGAAPAAGQPGAAQPEAAPPAPGVEQRTRVILAASPEVAQRLVAANAKGELNLTIRNPVSRDRLPLAETREYPSRVAAGPPQKAAAAPASNDNNSRRDRGSYEPPVMQPMFPPPAPINSVPPAPIRSDDTPSPVPDKDVTVIRGTEKTRVIVPR